MLFNNIKKYLLVLYTLLLVFGNTSFAIDSKLSQYDCNRFKYVAQLQQEYSLIGKIASYIIHENICDINELIKKLNKDCNQRDYNHTNRVESFSIAKQRRVRDDTVRAALMQKAQGMSQHNGQPEYEHGHS